MKPSRPHARGGKRQATPAEPEALTERLELRVSPSELEAYEAAAAAESRRLGLRVSVSAWIRRTLNEATETTKAAR